MPYTYEPVPGLFKVTTWEENIVNSFGLQLPSWAAFCRRIEQLAAEGNGDIKVVYCARHGEAEHNVLSRKYGCTETEAQTLYPITDPLLTAVGRRQAMTLGGVFAAESAMGMPLPTKFFVSPMRRPGETLGLEWGWLFKAGAVSRPGSPSPGHTPLPGLSAPSSPSKPAQPAKPAQASAAQAAQAAQAAGAKLTEALQRADGQRGGRNGRDGRDGVLHAPAPKRPTPGRMTPCTSAPGSPPKIAVGGATPTTPGGAKASAPAPGTNSTHSAPQGSDELAHVKAILASSPALALPEAQGGMSHGVPGLVIEELREHLHVHECDKRLTLTELRALFPHFTFPDGPDEDTVWRPTGRETEDEMVARARRGLDILFDLAQDDRYVSLTAHSGLLRAVYKNLGIPYRRLVTGEMNVLVIRVHRVPDGHQHKQNGTRSPP